MTRTNRRTFLGYTSLAITLGTGAGAANFGDNGTDSTDSGKTDQASVDTDNQNTSNTSDSESRSESDTESTDGTDSADTERDGDGFTISLEPIETVFEGDLVYVTVSVQNPTSDDRAETVTLTRDGRQELLNEDVLLPPGGGTELTAQWYVRNDAAGHTMELRGDALHDSTSEIVSGRSQFYPVIEETYVHDGDVHVEYRIQNDGSAPDSHEITVTVDGNPDVEHTEHLGIGWDEVFTHSFPQTNEEHVVEIRTENTMVRETVTVPHTK